MIKTLNNKEIEIIKGGNFDPVEVGLIVGSLASGVLFTASGSLMMYACNRPNDANTSKLRDAGLCLTIFGLGALTGSIGIAILSVGN